MNSVSRVRIGQRLPVHSEILVNSSRNISNFLPILTFFLLFFTFSYFFTYFSYLTLRFPTFLYLLCLQCHELMATLIIYCHRLQQLALCNSLALRGIWLNAGQNAAEARSRVRSYYYLFILRDLH